MGGAKSIEPLSGESSYKYVGTGSMCYNGGPTSQDLLLMHHRLSLPAIILGLAFISSRLPADEPAPVALWDFGTEERTRLELHGEVHRDQTGPRPPEFPDFAPDNTSVKFGGEGSHFSFADPGENSPFDFTNGDSITLEAWVNVEKLSTGENPYIIGKGRTAAAGATNQNWALRVREQDGLACLNFLFASTDRKWHRWTTTVGFKPGSGWHHLAVTYQFGAPESIRGYIDGLRREGTWDMDGPAATEPIVDNDEIWIGASQNGAKSSSFRGSIDELAIFRAALSEDALRKRFRREGPTRDDGLNGKAITKALPEVVPDLGQLPTGVAQVTVHENIPAHDRWLREGESFGPVVDAWTSSHFLLTRLAKRYDDWGIKSSWKGPLLVRIAADVELPQGKHRFLVRARGLSRLWVDDQLVTKTRAQGGSTDGHESVAPLPEPPHPGLRAVGYGDQEVFGEANLVRSGVHRVILELVVGGKKYRAEPGEVVVAVETPDQQSFQLLSTEPLGPSSLALTDAEVSLLSQRLEASLREHDDQTRRTAAAAQDPFWQKRHDYAKQWAESHPAPQPPGEGHPIDAFLSAKLSAAVQNSQGSAGTDAQTFHQDVLPLLRDHCFRCHGEKEKGGLRLNSRSAALAAADSGEPAVVPGHPETSELIRRLRSDDEGERMPPSAPLTAAQIDKLEQWIRSGAEWPAPPVTAEQATLTAKLDDANFMRRAYFDAWGIPPSADDLREFLANQDPNKRSALIDRLLNDERTADQWVSYWQDVLAENPNMLKPSLNNSGPFRYFLHEALRDNKPIDRWVTELIMLRGSEREGGSAGFGLAADNDAPMAAKGQIIASAFLGVELQCARCHDSPYHSTLQKDLYSLAAMMARKEVTVPKTSSVAPGFFANKERESLIKVTLQPGEPVPPQWPFASTICQLEDSTLTQLMQDPKDSRERLAAILTAPDNERFAQVIVNRLWKQLIGIGLVEPAHDWEGRQASHPELLSWLAHDFVAHGYDARHLLRTIMTSELYQRASIAQTIVPADQQFFVAPQRRRLSAEQVVDALFSAAGQKIDVEELSFDPRQSDLPKP